MDVRTMAIMGSAVTVLLAVVLFVQYRFNRDYPGIGWWAAGSAALAGGFVVSLLRGPSTLGQVAVPLYQCLFVLGPVLIYIGVLRFFAQRGRPRALIGLWIALSLWATFFTFIIDEVKARTMALYLVLGIVLLVLGRALWRYRLPTARGSATYLAVVFLASGVTYLLLVVAEALRTEPANVFFAPSPVNAVAFLAAVASTMLWTFGLVVMINQRLSGELAMEARNFHSVFTTSPESAIISRLSDGTIDDVNEGFTRLTGYLREEVIGESAVTLDLWVDPARREELVTAIKERGAVADFPFVMRRKDGSTVDCLLSASALTLNNEPYLVTVARDVTVQRRMEEELRHEATTDSLTGLSNRRHFLTVCERELQRAERSGGRLAVAILDIDHFKDINDNYGHAVGDAAVIAFADAVSARIREIDTVGRLGGDEFGLLLPDADLAQAHAALRRVCQQVAATPIVIDGHGLPLTLSAGVVQARAGDDVDMLLVRADRALYDAKEAGRNRVVAVDA